MATPAKISTYNLPTVALVGRVNVGKSTLFNRLIEDDKAIVSPVPGTTRTNNEGVIIWRGKNIRLIDTGGLTFTDDVPLEEDILKQSEHAMKEADVILFVADAQDGILPQDRLLAKRMRRIAHKPVIFLANKVDKQSLEYNLNDQEWLKLGMGVPFPVSGANGRNTGDLLDLVYKTLGKAKALPKKITKPKTEIINISLIGKPNVGKSSLFNKLIGQEKVIVNPMAHTTREPHDTLVEYEYEPAKPDMIISPLKGETTRAERVRKGVCLINFVDTAGIRRKNRVEGGLERDGIGRSIRAAENSDIILLVIDAAETISAQDMQLAGLLEKRAKSVIILINKWDLTPDNSDTYRNEVKRMIYSQFPHLDFAPILFVSGLTSYRVHDIFPLLMRAWQARHTVISNEILYRFIKQVQKQHLPSRGKGTKYPEIIGFHQLANNPPVFEALIKYRTSLNRAYVNYLENKLREQFDFFATPIIIHLTKLKR
jgi:GTP-binding protein